MSLFEPLGILRMPMAANEHIGQKDQASEAGPAIGHVAFPSYAPGDETGITDILNACHDHEWGDEEWWQWKHSHRPTFSADDVTVAVVDDQMAGCFHGAVLPFRLEAGLEVPMCFEGDFAVLPKYRKAGLPLRAHDLADRRLLDAGVILRGGFTSLELNERFYHRQFGYIFAPTVTTEFRKIIGLAPLQKKVAELNEHLLEKEGLRKVLRGIRLVIDLTIDRLPPSHVELSEHQIALHPGFASDAHMKVQIPYAVLVASKSGRGRLLQALLSHGIRGRIRLKGLRFNAGWLAKGLVQFFSRGRKA